MRTKIIFLLLLLPLFSFAQSDSTRIITGKIVGIDSLPLPGFNVYIVDHNEYGTITDLNGNFILEIPVLDDLVIVCHAVSEPFYIEVEPDRDYYYIILKEEDEPRSITRSYVNMALCLSYYTSNSIFNEHFRLGLGGSVSYFFTWMYLQKGINIGSNIGLTYLRPTDSDKNVLDLAYLTISPQIEGQIAKTRLYVYLGAYYGYLLFGEGECLYYSYEDISATDFGFTSGIRFLTHPNHVPNFFINYSHGLYDIGSGAFNLFVDRGNYLKNKTISFGISVKL